MSFEPNQKNCHGRDDEPAPKKLGNLGMAKYVNFESKQQAARWCREMILGDQGIPYRIQITWDRPKRARKAAK